MSIQVPDGLFQVKLRFTDGLGNYSKKHTKSSILVEQDVLMFYNEYDSFDPMHSLYASHLSETEDGPILFRGGFLATSGDKEIRFRESVVECFGNFLLRASRLQNNNSTYQYQYKFLLEQIDLLAEDLLPTTLLEINGPEIYRLNDMTFHEGVMYLACSDGLYTLNSNEEWALNKIDPSISTNSIASYNGVLYGVTDSSDLRAINTDTFEWEGDALSLNPTYGFSKNSIISIRTSREGVLFAIAELRAIVENESEEVTLWPAYKHFCILGETESGFDIVPIFGVGSGKSMAFDGDNNLIIHTDEYQFPNQVEEEMVSTPTDKFSIYRYNLSDEVSTPEKLLKTYVQDFHDKMALTKDKETGVLYAIGMKFFNDSGENSSSGTLECRSIDTRTREVSSVAITDEYFKNIVMTTKSSLIYNSQNNMYDGGNYINTNRFAVVEYTHNQQNEIDLLEDSYPSDGTINDGTKWFGSGSSYFTNLYPGLFVLAAENIDIHTFFITGNLGASYAGFASYGDFDVILNETLDYSVCYKSVYGAQNASVHHLIIIPTKSGVIHSASDSTNEDQHSVTNLENVEKLYYLLFSTHDGDNGTSISEEDLSSIALAFLEIVHSSEAASLSDLLENLGTQVSEITSNIDNISEFSDSGLQSYSSQNFVGGVSEIHCAAHVGNNEIMLIADLEDSRGVIFKLNTSTGSIKPINCQSLNLGQQSINQIEFHDGSVYAIASDESVNTIGIINPDTGEFLNNVNKKFTQYLTVFDQEINANPMSIHSYDGELHCIYKDGSDYQFYHGTINTDTFEVTRLAKLDGDADPYDFRITSGKPSPFLSLSESTPKYYSFKSYFSGSGNNIRVELGIQPEELTNSNMTIEWCHSDDFNWTDQNESPWTAIEEYDATFDGNWDITFSKDGLPNPNYLYVRLKYKDDESGNWVFSYYD
jgi:hypothetical protein